LSTPYQPVDISFTKIFPQTDGTVFRKSMEISIFQPENIKGHYHSGDLDVDGRIILKWISSMVQESLLDESDSWKDPLAVFCKPNKGKYMSGSIKEGYLDHINDS
jgi:hypothetical protein